MVLWAVLSFSRGRRAAPRLTDSKASAPVPAKAVQHGQYRNVAQAIKGRRAFVAHGMGAMAAWRCKMRPPSVPAILAQPRAATSQISATLLLLMVSGDLTNFAR